MVRSARQAPAVLLALLGLSLPLGPVQAESLISSGTGFVVSPAGDILTNNHVIAACESVRVRSATSGQRSAPVAAVVAARDPRNDLALLKARLPTTGVATFRDGHGIRAGESVVAIGFPLANMLAAEANVSVGIVSALAGLNNDARYLQVSAPVQPGNSGGPLLDAAGNVTGIITAKLNALKIAGMNGDIPQNVNFAVKSEVAREFLDLERVGYRTAPSKRTLAPADIGDLAKGFTVFVECFGTPRPNTAAAPPGATAPNAPPPQAGAVSVTVAEAVARGVDAYRRKDFATAANWHRVAAEKGSAISQNALGILHLRGLGVPQNFAAAMAWFQKAAAQDNSDGQANLGAMYALGTGGIPRDYAQAVALYRKSAEHGNAAGQNNLGAAYKDGIGVPQDDAQAFAWFTKAAEQGNAQAQLNLGRLYEAGHGVPKDMKLAREWIRLAAAGGNEAAKTWLESH